MLENSSEDVPLLEDVNEVTVDRENDDREHTERQMIRMLNEDGTIFEMEDNIVLPDMWNEEDSDDDILDLNVSVAVSCGYDT